MVMKGKKVSKFYGLIGRVAVKTIWQSPMLKTPNYSICNLAPNLYVDRFPYIATRVSFKHCLDSLVLTLPWFLSS